MTVHIANPQVSDAAKAAVEGVLDSGMLAAGAEVEAFEREFAAYVGTGEAVATANGTAALHALLEAAGVGAGDAVVTPAFSFVASANAVVHAGAEPVFADVRPATGNLDPDAVREVLESRDDVAAVLAVHLYGLPAAMGELRELADAFDVALFADAAQAHGARCDGDPVGSVADAAAFSFYPTKNMTTGEGGMVTTDDADLAARARRLVDHGRTGRYEHEVVGYNYRMTNVGAAIGRDQLERLPGWVERRRENAARLTERLSGVDGVETPVEPTGRRHAYHQYTVRVADRGAVTDSLDDADVGYGIYYPETIPGQPAYGERRGWPAAERLSAEVVSVPVHPFLDAADVDRVADAVERGVGA